MNFHGHLKASALVGASVTVLAMTQGMSATFGLYSFLGGLFPDLDTNSTPSKWAAAIGVIATSNFLLAGNPYPAALIGFLFMLAKVDKHRGWTHSIFLPVILAGLGYKLGLLLEAMAFGLGCYVHLFCDSKMIKKFTK